MNYAFFEEPKLPDEVRRKIYRYNAEKVFGLKNEGINRWIVDSPMVENDVDP